MEKNCAHNLPLHRKSFDPKDLAGGRYICLDCRKWLRKVERIKIQIRLRGEEWAWGKKSELERAAAAYNEALKQTKRRK